MVLYRITPPSLEHEPEGEDRAEWFSARGLAMKRFREIRDEILSREGALEIEYALPTCELERVTFPKMKPKAFTLYLLNRGWKVDADFTTIAEVTTDHHRAAVAKWEKVRDNEHE